MNPCNNSAKCTDSRANSTGHCHSAVALVDLGIFKHDVDLRSYSRVTCEKKTHLSQSVLHLLRAHVKRPLLVAICGKHNDATIIIRQMEWCNVSYASMTDRWSGVLHLFVHLDGRCNEHAGVCRRPGCCENWIEGHSLP